MLQFLQEAGSKKVPYTEKHMRQKLDNHFGETIIFTSIRGKANVVTFRSSAEKILKDFSKEIEKDSEREKLRIIKTAALLLLSDIKAMDTSKEDYPANSDVANLDKNLEFLPSSVTLLLSTLFHDKKGHKLKIASIGQALVQAVRPKVLIAPLQLGLGVEIHHLSGSKYLVDHLSKMGFSSSYSEVKKYEQSAALTQGIGIQGVTPASCVQFVADNVDHNIQTLDGTGTFHGMGMIAAVTPALRSVRSIKRDVNATAELVKNIGRIPVKLLSSSNSLLKLDYGILQSNHNSANAFIDLLWKISWPLRSPRPGWSGTMQAVCDGHYPGQSCFTFLPMIDMDPTDMSCVFTTLHFLSALAKEYHVTPVVTFDQPLWWKARIIVSNETDDSPLRSIVLQLGGFHTEMSFLGSIGRLMAGSGLQQLLEVAFAPNAIIHMLTGKSVARAVRGHFIVDAVLNAIIASMTFNYSLENIVELYNEEAEVDIGDNEDLKLALLLYDQVMDKTIEAENLETYSELQRLQEEMVQTKNELKKSRTSGLWLQYMDMVDVLRRFLRAERTGNWLHHLQALQEMLPYLAATGHNLYTKSVYIYLQDMQQLQQQHPDVLQDFLKGHHVIRRSDRYWAGLSTDLAIEQLLMRSVKSVGGLTRGRGMDESQRAQWLLSMPACADMNSAMQEVTGMEFFTSDQHTDSTESRKKKDDKDMRAVLGFLLLHNPFSSSDPSLRNICTGVVADPSVNADSAKETGEAIIQDMVGKKVTDFKFKKKEQVISMDLKRCVRIDDDSIQVDPQLLFQRLVTAAMNSQTEDFEISSIFEFELNTPPASLFDSTGLMREATKSKLLDCFPSLEEDSSKQHEKDGTEYVLDGGSLLHRLSWKKGDTFGRICQVYAEFVVRQYRRPIVVFDSYSCEPSTKDTAHLRRSGGTGQEVRGLTQSTQLCTKKHIFLSNQNNKQAFVSMLGEILESYGCRIVHAQGDADTLIVKTALKCSAIKNTCVIGEDTDLLVLLCFHVKPSDKAVFCRSDKRSGTKQQMWHIQQVQQCLKPQIVKALPFLHAINGCDTTSRLYGIGKTIPVKKMDDPIFMAASSIFCTKDQNPDTDISEGEKALVSLYNGQPGVTLDTLRYHRFCEKAATCVTAIQVQSLPPTSAAAKYHSLRVYLQVQEWIQLHQDLDPQLWGWQISSGRFEARTTDLPPAPDFLLRFVRCNCKTDCRSKLCTCRKHGLECSLACGECKGLSCYNSPNFEDAGESLDDIGANLPDLGDLSNFLK